MPSGEPRDHGIFAQHVIRLICSQLLGRGLLSVGPPGRLERLFRPTLIHQIRSRGSPWMLTQSRKAATTSGSNWVPEQRRNSATAASKVRGLL